jgi:hypothetical protein
VRVNAYEIARREIPRIALNMVVDMPRSLMRHFFRHFFVHRRRWNALGREICPFIDFDLSFFSPRLLWGTTDR